MKVEPWNINWLWFCQINTLLTQVTLLGILSNIMKCVKSTSVLLILVWLWCATCWNYFIIVIWTVAKRRDWLTWLQNICHPLLPGVLAKLFNLLIRVGFVPDKFGSSFTVSLFKVNNKSKLLTFDDFHGSSISIQYSFLKGIYALHYFKIYMTIFLERRISSFDLRNLSVAHSHMPST
jgi:hypothetical protein